MRVKALQEVVRHVSANDTRFGRNELKYVRTIDINALRKEADTYAKQYREHHHFVGYLFSFYILCIMNNRVKFYHPPCRYSCGVQPTSLLKYLQKKLGEAKCRR